MLLVKLVDMEIVGVRVELDSVITHGVDPDIRAVLGKARREIGIINVAESHPKGWQVGLVNYTKDTEGHKIGLVNVNPSTTIDFMVFAGTSSKLNSAIRFRNKSTYNVIGMGTHYMGFDEDFSGALFYRLGQYAQLTPKFSLSGDIGYFHL